ncbi:MAG: class I tRNA ligase family protein [Phycisphaerae bacterium]|nr:class I tRNA ligase family protein [Phycisphaerae bacterium]
MTKELAKVYDPKQVEQRIYDAWIRTGAFAADPNDPRARFCMVIPPPNVTAALHLGHALNNTLQDVIIRFRRMREFATLWMPGTDHAGIATQTVVEKRLLAEEGKRRTEYERSEFVHRVQEWKDEYEERILTQLKTMGCSCDWDRTRFTMDEVCARAVRETFFRLFKDGLIYRGKRLVNWDPETRTVLADDEVEHEDVHGHFYYLRYPLVGSGLGVPPKRGLDVPSKRTTDVSSVENNEEGIDKRQGAFLPHWTQKGATYSVSFRLVDSLPRNVLESWRIERQSILDRAEKQNRSLTRQEEKELAKLYSQRVEAFLDVGHGQCYLRNDEVAEMVKNALLHFDGDRYDLIAWCIMPNHVHVVIRPKPEYELSKILQSWKSFTAKQANTILGLEGTFWQQEYYDHLIRDEEDFCHAVNYVLSNPGNAGLENWLWVGRTNQGQDAPETLGPEAQATLGQDVQATTFVTVATTRPETMLGDTAVAMNPSDPRAEFLVGRKVRLPIVGREIPIIADDHVVLPDPAGDDEKAKFSTGFLKVTPAHDPDDYQIGLRHDLPLINVMAPDGRISHQHGWGDWEEIKNPDVENIIGMDRFEARQAVVEFFRQEKLLEDVRDYVHSVGHSYRSHVPIEPYLSDQWYVAVKKPIENLKSRFSDLKIPTEQKETEEFGTVTYLAGTDVPVNSLAGLALIPLLDGRLTFIPDRYAKTYQTWLENLRDWPISRQLWWGHQIPVWTLYFEQSDFAEDAQPDRLAQKHQPLIDKFFSQTGIEGEVGFWWSTERKDGDYPFYVCSHSEKADVVLDVICTFARHHATKKVAEVIHMKNEKNVLAQKMESLGYSSDEVKQIFSSVREIIDALAPRMKTESRDKKLFQGRDEDVLDTWFSSALWPFSTLGWPEETPELKKFYPGDVLSTAREIITLWVSRMVMMGQYCLGDIPFSTVFIHAMIQDGQGRKMSKSLGNGVDPLEVIDSHGADAMRYTLVSMTTQTQDVRMPLATMTLPDGREVNSSPKFDIGRNLCNKLWNAGRFVIGNLLRTPAWQDVRPTEHLTDAWILSRLNGAVRDATSALEQYRFNELAERLYHFLWDEFCDWYLEIAKVRIHAGDQTPKALLAHVLDVTLRLLHPICPFITEAIWENLNAHVPARGPANTPAEPMLVRAEWPRADGEAIDPPAEAAFGLLQDLIRQVRNVRTQHNVPPANKLDAVAEVIEGTSEADILSDNVEMVIALAGLRELKISYDPVPPSADAASVSAGGVKLSILGAVDRDAEITRLTKRKETLTKGVMGVQNKLNNHSFIAKAPEDVVQREKARLEEMRRDLQAVEESLTALR